MSIKTQFFSITKEKQREVQSDNCRKFTYYMVCVSYEKKTIKRQSLKVLLLEVQVLGPGKFKILLKELHRVFRCPKTHTKYVVFGVLK